MSFCILAFFCVPEYVLYFVIFVYLCVSLYVFFWRLRFFVSWFVLVIFINMDLLFVSIVFLYVFCFFMYFCVSSFCFWFCVYICSVSMYEDTTSLLRVISPFKYPLLPFILLYFCFFFVFAVFVLACFFSFAFSLSLFVSLFLFLSLSRFLLYVGFVVQNACKAAQQGILLKAQSTYKPLAWSNWRQSNVLAQCNFALCILAHVTQNEFSLYSLVRYLSSKFFCSI